MAEKNAVLLKHQYLDYIENAKLSDSDSGLFLKSIIKYDKTGVESVFKNPVLTALFAVVKFDIDKNNKNWKETINAKREAGREGMRKRWAEKEDNITEDNTNNTSYQSITEITQITNITDSGSDSDSVNVNDSGGGKSQPPPQDFIQIKKESASHGFFIDTVIAKKFQKSSIDPSWLIAPYSFLQFCAESVRKKYPDKGDENIKPIFISAVTSWEELRETYPTWRKKQEEKVRKKEIDEARENEPPCKCGGKLWRVDTNKLRCIECGAMYRFDEKVLAWVFDEQEAV